jgi:hypothetical protein
VAFAAVRCDCSQAAASTEFLMRVAYVEIYNEMCRDLLDKHSPDNMQESPPHRTAPHRMGANRFETDCIEQRTCKHTRMKCVSHTTVD